MTRAALLCLCLFSAALGFALAGGVATVIEAQRDIERQKQVKQTMETIDAVADAVREVCKTNR